MATTLKRAPDKVRLAKIGPADTGRFSNAEDVADAGQENLKRLHDLHYLMYAENRRALLVVLHGIDASGKDGLVRHIAGGLNPQGMKVHSFKSPSEEELDHDYLWRVHRAMPGRGEVALFNRSHYEEVSVVKVHPELLTFQNLPENGGKPHKIFAQRYRQINQFERMLAENGTVIMKFLLHISPEEQEQRFAERLQNPHRHWKFSKQDLLERQHWNTYMKVFEEMVEATNSPWAPWYIVPADKKWYRNYVAVERIVRTLDKLKMSFPTLLA